MDFKGFIDIFKEDPSYNAMSLNLWSQKSVSTKNLDIDLEPTSLIIKEYLNNIYSMLAFVDNCSLSGILISFQSFMPMKQSSL